MSKSPGSAGASSRDLSFQFGCSNSRDISPRRGAGLFRRENNIKVLLSHGLARGMIRRPI
jgi:hypothetical protein